ncbi:MAG: DUF6348 family protein [Planctomycetota bacterium]
MEPNAALLETLTSHGIAARLDGGWISVPGSRAVIRARCYEVERHEGAVVARLDVSVGLDDGRLLVESMGAPGPDADGALGLCMAKFVAGSLHPLLGAFFGHKEHQEIETWSAGGKSVDVYLGPLLVQAGTDKPPTTPAIGTTVKELVSARADVAARPHWLRFFYARVGQNPPTFEALWDGEPWPELAQAMEKLEWPKEGEYVSLRMFLCTVPVGAAAGKHDYRSAERAVLAMVDACAKDRGLNDDGVFEKLLAAGVDSALAEDTIHFGPLGFTTILFHGLDLSPEYQVVDSSNNVVATKPLAGEPPYVAAREVAADLVGVPELRDKFMAVASRCTRFSQANEVLAAGNKLDGVKFPPPMLFRDYRAREAPATPVSTADPDKPAAARPWWKIW